KKGRACVQGCGCHHQGGSFLASSCPNCCQLPINPRHPSIPPPQTRIMSSANTSTPLPRIKLKLPTAATPAEGTPSNNNNGSGVKLGSVDVRKGSKKKTSAASTQGTGAKKRRTSSLGASLVPSPVLTSEVDPVGAAAADGHHNVVVAGSTAGKT